MWCVILLPFFTVVACALESIPSYNWKEFTDLWHLNVSADAQKRTVPEVVGSLSSLCARLNKQAAQDVVGKPVYVSMTTISSRLYGIGDTIESLIGGEQLPTRIFVFISEKPHLLDEGISKNDLAGDETLKLRLLYRLYPYISIVYVDNIGSHRKLLPLLSEKWDEDCLLVTVDDHEIYPKNMLSSLIDYYIDSGGLSVVARRARRMGICAGTPPWSLCPYTNANRRGLWPETKPARYEMLLLPTGTGGILYRPVFFHPSIFEKALWEATLTGDDLMFRLGTMSKGVPVVTTCCQDQGLRAVCPPRSTSKRYISKSQELMKLRIAESWGLAFTEVGFHEKSHNLKLKKRQYSSSHVLDHMVDHSDSGQNNADTGKGQDEQEQKIKGDRARARQIKKKRRKEHGRVDHKNSIVSRNSENSEVEELLVRRLRKKSRKINRRPRRSRDSLHGDAVATNFKRHLDSRKETSLATKFNNIGGNSIMWARATEYLKGEGVLDFNHVLSIFAQPEREQCLLTPSTLGPGRGNHVGIMGSIWNWWDGSLMAIQNLWDTECGIHLCST